MSCLSDFRKGNCRLYYPRSKGFCIFTASLIVSFKTGVEVICDSGIIPIWIFFASEYINVSELHILLASPSRSWSEDRLDARLRLTDFGAAAFASVILQRRLGWMTGFEPATPGTTIQCSNQLSYIHHIRGKE